MHDQPSSQTCPTCGLPPEHAVTNRTGRIVSATLVCALDHLWIVKWAAQQPALEPVAAP